MTIYYKFEDSLYVNLTNRCNYHCTFCLRQKGDGIVTEDTLFLEKEPTKEEILSDLLHYNLEEFRELVFCGYGEPTYRMDAITWALTEMKSQRKLTIPVRINTNGTGNVLNDRDITQEMVGLIQKVSISLNASDSQGYASLCLPDEGEKSFVDMLEFATKAKNNLLQVVFTIVDTGENHEEIEKCRKISQEMGIPLRLRPLIMT